MTTAPDSDELLQRSAAGETGARDQLLGRHREQLRRMVDARLDRRLAARLDPSDVVQDVLLEAARRLPEYLHDRPMPFYPWLRELVSQRLIDLHRRHIRAQRRSVRREQPGGLALPEESAHVLADRLVASATGPSQQLVRKEARARALSALQQLSVRDREVLELRHLEQLSVAETAAALGVTEAAVKTRHLRALTRLRDLLDPSGEKKS